MTIWIRILTEYPANKLTCSLKIRVPILWYYGDESHPPAVKEKVQAVITVIQKPMAFNVRQILLVVLVFDVVVLQFCTYICNWTFKFPILYSNCRFDIVCFTIQLCSFEVFNIQVYAIQHPSLRNSTFNFQRCMFSISNRKPVNDTLILQPFQLE